MTGIPQSVFDGGARSPEPAPGPEAAGGTNLITPAGWFVDAVAGGTHTDSGAHVTPEKALTYTAFYSAVNLIAGTIASLPLRIYQRASAKVVNEQPDHPLAAIFSTQFNPDMTALVGRETGLGHLLVWGNSFCQIVKTLSGKVLELRPLPPNAVEPRRSDRGDLKYDVYSDGKVELTLDAAEVLHVPAMGFDGVRGYSPVAVARQAIGMGLSAEKFGNKFFAQSARPSGVVKFPPGKGFKTEQPRLRFREDIERAHSGTDNMGRVIILEDGADWQSIGIPPEDAQFLETRQYQRSEINAIFRTPPHLTGDVSASTSWGSGIEEQGLAFVAHTLRPWLTKIEQEYNRKLLGVGSNTYCAHDVGELQRGDVAKRTDALGKLFDRGGLEVNELRAEFGRNPIAGGNRAFVAVNMRPLDSVDEAPPSPPPAPKEKPKPAASARLDRLADSLRNLFREAVGGCIRREAQAARRAAGKPDKFVAWLDEFYAEHEAFVADKVRPALVAWWAAFPGADNPPDAAAEYARRHCDASREMLLAAAETKADQLAGAVDRRVSDWELHRAGGAANEMQPPEHCHAA